MILSLHTLATVLRGTRMRVLYVGLATVLATTAGPVLAQQAPPAGLQPLPEVPPPPRMSSPQAGDEKVEPTVTIRQENGNRIEEFRARGRLYAVRVTPTIGKPYLLVDKNGTGTMTRMDDMSGGVNPPQWTLFNF